MFVAANLPTSITWSLEYLWKYLYMHAGIRQLVCYVIVGGEVCSMPGPVSTWIGDYRQLATKVY